MTLLPSEARFGASLAVLAMNIRSGGPLAVVALESMTPTAPLAFPANGRLGPLLCHVLVEPSFPRRLPLTLLSFLVLFLLRSPVLELEAAVVRCTLFLV
jgi:hypothetical protein